VNLHHLKRNKDQMWMLRHPCYLHHHLINYYFFSIFFDLDFLVEATEKDVSEFSVSGLKFLVDLETFQILVKDQNLKMKNWDSGFPQIAF